MCAHISREVIESIMSCVPEANRGAFAIQVDKNVPFAKKRASLLNLGVPSQVMDEIEILADTGE